MINVSYKVNLTNENAPYQFNSKIDKAEAALIKIIGAKFKESRGLNGSSPTSHMSIDVASKLLGVDRKYLSNLESGISCDHVPAWLIKKASEIYDVSADFLLGLSADEWERDPALCFERDFGRGLHRAHMEELAKLGVQHERQQKRQDILTDVAAKMLALVDDVFQSLENFRKSNPRFDEMPAGSQLAYRVRQVHQTANEAKHQMMHGKLIPVTENKSHDD